MYIYLFLIVKVSKEFLDVLFHGTEDSLQFRALLLILLYGDDVLLSAAGELGRTVTLRLSCSCPLEPPNTCFPSISEIVTLCRDLGENLI